MAKLVKTEDSATPAVAATTPKVSGKKAVGKKPKLVRNKKKGKKVYKRGRGSKHIGVLFIKCLPKGFEEDALYEFFRQFGDIKRVCVARSKRTQQSKGFGYVVFQFYEVAEIAASAVNNYIMWGRVLKTDVLPKSMSGVPRNFGRVFKSKEDCMAYHQQRMALRVKKMNKPIGHQNARGRCLYQLDRLKRADKKMREAGLELPELQNHLLKLQEKAIELRGQVQDDLAKQAAELAAQAAAAAAKAADEAAAAVAKVADEAAAAIADATKATVEQEKEANDNDNDDDDEERESIPCKWKTIEPEKTDKENADEEASVEKAISKAKAAAKKLAKGTINLPELKHTNKQKQQSEEMEELSAEKMQVDTETKPTPKTKKQTKKTLTADAPTKAQKDQESLPKEKKLEKTALKKKQTEDNKQSSLPKKQQKQTKAALPSLEKTDAKKENLSVAKKKQREEKVVAPSSVEKKQAKNVKPKTFEKKQSEASVVTTSPKVKRKLSIKDGTTPAKMARKVKS